MTEEVRPNEHPDANLLGAFAENALPRQERDTVALHLASCADCRECLAMAFGTPLPAVKREPARPAFRIWWAAAAAAVACCALSIVWFVREPRAPQREAAAVLVPPAIVPAAPQPSMSPARQLQKQTLRAFKPPAVKTAPAPAVTVAEIEPPPASSLNTAQPVQAHALVAASSQQRLATEAGTRHAPIMAGRFQPLERKVRPAALARRGSVLWTVDGVVQRSFDDGVTWQTVPIDAGVSFRAVTAAGSEVWAGGSGGALYRSRDAGAHWIRSGPADLTGAVISIDASQPPAIVVTTSAGERWTSTDSGQHWKQE